MKKQGILLTVTVVSLLALPAAAQQGPSAAPVLDAVRATMRRMARNLVAAADDMPAEKYGFKPTPPQMSVGEVVLHLASGNEFLCSSVAGTKRPEETVTLADSAAGWAAFAPRAVARLKQSFEYCGTVLAKLDDSQLGDEVPWFAPGSKTSRANALIALPVDWQDHYSQLAIYLRLNGILPPTARGRRRT